MSCRMDMQHLQGNAAVFCNGTRVSPICHSMCVQQCQGSADLQKEEEHGFDLMLGPGHDQHASVASQVVPARDDRLYGFSHAILHEDEVVLSTNQHSSWAILATWHRNQKIGPIVHRLG